MNETTRNGKTVFSFAIRDTKTAWQAAQKYMSDKYFRPHEEYRDLYYTTAPGLGMQYLQFFKTENEIQVVTFLGGPVHPVPLSQIDPQKADSVRTALKGMLGPLQELEAAEAGQPQPAAESQPAPETAGSQPVQEAPAPEAPAPQPEPETPQQTLNYQQPLPTEIPQAADAGFVAGEAPYAQPTAQQGGFGYGASTQSRTIPQDPYGTRYAYDPVNGGPNDRASNAVAGLVFGIVGLLLAFLGMGVPVMGTLGLIPLTIGLILSVNGRRSRRRGIALAGMIICLAGIALVVFSTLIWFDIMAG